MTPTQEWIDQKKKEHGKVFKTTINNEVVFFRTIKRNEHLGIQKDVFPNGTPGDVTTVTPEDNARLENRIVEKCLLWPENVKVEDLDAGFPPMLTAMIMQYSGFGAATEPEAV